MNKNNPLTIYIKKRCQTDNKNFIAVFIGATGSGKTYAALDFACSISEECGTPFTIKDNVAFTFADALRKMELPQNQAPASVFLLEEVGSVGSGGSSSEWMSKANSFFSSFLQTSRHRNQILLFTTPNFSLLMKQGRELIHGQFVMESVNRQNKTSQARFYFAQTNPSTGKIYLKFMRLKSEEFRSRISRFMFHLPDKDMLIEYEAEKLKFTKALNKMIMDKLDGKEDIKKNGRKEAVSITVADEREFEKLYLQGVKPSKLAAMYNVTYLTVMNTISKLGLRDIKNMGGIA